MGEFMQTPLVKKQLAKRGLTEAQGRKLLTEQLKADGATGHQFRTMTKQQQRKAWNSGLAESSLIEKLLTASPETTEKAVRSVVGATARLGCGKGKNISDYVDLEGLARTKRTMFERAARYVPTEMLKTMKSGGVKAVYDDSSKRPYFTNENRTIHLVQGSDKFNVVHEMMHAVEACDSSFLESEKEYFDERVKGWGFATLQELTGNSLYEPDELAFDLGDESVHPYLFKSYPNSTNYELMSFGVELLYRMPSAYERDIDMVKWILKMLGGYRS